MSVADEIQFLLDNDKMDAVLFLYKSQLEKWVDDLNNEADSVGLSVLRGPFEFEYNTPNLADGVEFYTMKEGHFLLDAFMIVTTAWNGTTPLGDFGAVPWDSDNNDEGYFGFCWNAIKMDYSTSSLDDSLGAEARDGVNSLLLSNSTSMVWSMLQVPAISGNHAQQPLTHAAADPFNQSLPIYYEEDTPLSVAVTRTGIAGDADPGASQGAAKLYLKTSSALPF